MLQQVLWTNPDFQLDPRPRATLAPKDHTIANIACEFVASIQSCRSEKPPSCLGVVTAYEDAPTATDVLCDAYLPTTTP